MDDYREQIAGRKNQGLFSFLYFLACALLVICLMWALISLMGTFGSNADGSLKINTTGVLGIVVFGGLTVALWFLKDQLRVEYDYTFTQGVLDVSRVLNNRRRRYLTGLDLSTVRRCGPAEGPSYRKALLEPNQQKHSWYINKQAPLTYFCFEKKGVRHMILLELDEAMIELVRSGNYLPRGVWYNAEGKASSYGKLS